MDYTPEEHKQSSQHNLQNSIPETKCQNLSISEPIDLEASKQLGNNKLFYDLIEKLDEMSGKTSLPQLAECLKSKDWQRMHTLAHTLKGSSGYIGAARIHYACYYMQEAYREGNYEAMVGYYP